MTGASAETGSDVGADHPRFAELDALPTEELRQRAFTLAREQHDLKFFWSIFEHLPHADDAAERDDGLSSIGPTVDHAVALWREFTGHVTYGENEPILRAAFIDYLLKQD